MPTLLFITFTNIRTKASQLWHSVCNLLEWTLTKAYFFTCYTCTVICALVLALSQYAFVWLVGNFLYTVLFLEIVNHWWWGLKVKKKKNQSCCQNVTVNMVMGVYWGIQLTWLALSFFFFSQCFKPLNIISPVIYTPVI